MPEIHHKVKFVFSSTGDASTTWRVVRVHGREGLSELYTFVLDLANQDLAADPDKMLGRTAQFEMVRDHTTRRVSGVVHRVEHRGTTAGHLLCRVHLVPALLALSQKRNTRIFQNQPVPAILATVLGEGLAPFQKTFRPELVRPYPVREYCVQYRETDLAFVTRLMAEEGIAFFFDFSDLNDEVMVLVDANEPYTPITTGDGGAVPIMGDEGGTAENETVRHFDGLNQLQTTSVVVRDFDWTQPTLDLTRESRATDVNGMDREEYEYPPPLTIGDYSNPRYTAEDGAPQARLRAEGHHGRERRFEGDGYVTGFTAGYTFELSGHGRPSFDGEYLLTRVEHRGYAPEELTNETTALDVPGQERYHNSFECIPKSVVFRPARDFVRPKIGGVQTATVVGPAGEEIYTDEHGRIKVQFHWDRVGHRDENSSCWIRVMQSWAGAGWGFVWIPRIGMEVVVQFLEGNPDRPLVTGCVYNGQNTPPYPLPDEKTKSTIKSNSTPGGHGSNELRFEDMAGSEEVYLHAQKDFNELVEHDHSTTVRRDQRNHVLRNQTENVDCNQTMTVGGNRTSHVHGEEKKTVEKDQTDTVHKNRTHTVDLDEKITVHGNQITAIDLNRTETVGQNEAVTVTGNATHLYGGNLTTAVGGMEVRTVGRARMTTVTLADIQNVIGVSATQVTGAYSVQAVASITMTCAPTSMSLTPGKFSVSAPDKITLTSGGSSLEMVPGKITLSTGGGAEIVLDGANVKITGAQVELDASAAGKFISGGTLDLNGMTTTIIGSPVKINC